MREVIELVHKGLRSEQYVSDRICNSDFECNHLNRCGSSVQKLVIVPESNDTTRCTLRYTIDVKWRDPIPVFLGSSPFCVREKRTVTKHGAKYVIESVFHTDHKNLNGTVRRVLQDIAADCVEEISVDIEWDGSTLKKEIEEDFFKSLRRRIVLQDDTDAESNVDDNSVVQFQEYHSVHDQLESLASLSEQFLRAVDDAKLDRGPLVLPSGDQISQVSEYVNPDRFSIRDDVRDMRAEVERTQRLVSEIKRARQQTSNSSVLPIFILASCAAALFLVISRTKKSEK